MTQTNSARLDQLIDELLVNHHGAPVIGASLVPLVLRAQGIEVVPCLMEHLDPGRIKIDPWRRQTEKWQTENTPPKSEITGPNSFLTSAGIGTMGSGLPQALGAQLAQPDRLVIDIQGDEGFFCCGSELRTAARYALPIKVLIINNGSQCIVRQWTTNMFDGNNVGVIDHVDGVADMDFVTNAQSYGVEAERVTRKNDLAAALRRAIRSLGPYVLDCVVPHEECYPWIKPGTGFPQIVTRNPPGVT